MRFLACFEKIKKERVFVIAFLIVVCAGIFTMHKSGEAAVTTFAMPASKKIVVVDAGHGGWDPGMIGVNGTEEKDINLLIAEKLQTYLELGGAYVIVTRGGDEAVGDTKRKDLNDRSKLADNADIFVSIHQNSFPARSVRGAQVFYYDKSDESKRLADCVQKQFQSYLDPGNKREAKANSKYYLLKKTSIPAVIVECGFLSNPSEGKLLSADEYQEKVAWTIYMGIVNYFAGENNNEQKN